MKPEQCCDEPRGFVGGVCDHCGGEVQSEFTNLELQQQVSEWRSSSYYLEMDRDKWKAAAVAFEKERDEAIAERDDWKDFAFEHEKHHAFHIELFKKESHSIHKQLAKQLTLLQEHGLAEYGN